MTSFPEKATPPSAGALPPPGPGVQATLEDLGTPLDEVTFVVVDLETTGAGPGAHAITEIGAVRVRGGQIRSELATLVNPGAAIPAQVTVLTGITNAMVLDAPPVASALTELLGWARLDEPDTVLVAHNARFDVGHLRGASRALGLAWTFHWYYALLFFIGGVIGLVIERRNPAMSEEFTWPVASGIVAGGSLMGVALVMWANGPGMLRALFGG